MHPEEIRTAGRCLVCGESLARRFPNAKDPFTGERFSIHRCVRCGLGVTVPRPPDPDNYYPEKYYGNRHGMTSNLCTRRRLRFVESAMGQRAVERLLDIGCGDGTFLLAAKGAGWEVAGTERNPGPARAEGLDVREAPERFHFSESFDCITMWHSFEHIPDPLAAISGLSGLLKPGGKLIMAVPDNGGLQAKIFRNGWLHLDVPRHLYHFDAGSLRYCLALAGFSIERQWHQEFEYDLFGWVQSAMNFLFPQPNIFFDFITGRPRGCSVPLTVLNVVLGTVITVLFLPAVLIGTAAGRGGTLVAVARRSESPER